MKTKFHFTIQNLLYNAEYLKGPIAQVLFAKRFIEYEGAFIWNRLARVVFENEATHKALPGAVPLEETLLLGTEGFDYSTLHLCIRGKSTCCRVATGYFPKRVAIMHDDYKQAILLHKLTDNQIHKVFTYVWDHPETIQPSDKPFPHDY
ncbi:MAG: hypothetical protein J0H29_01700 [Sphingobacteriales bacterium]|nr:hypothetical protein [Sphingobacteriales bacterium]OJY89376.1 MAG: hypothetical protein BGP14_05595 [Sphingobacteriales bacterium 44-15]